MLVSRRQMPVPAAHDGLGNPLTGPFPEGLEQAVLGMGCFWGAERVFWQAPGVWTTAVGYAGGGQDDPTYEEVCTGRTGHAEVVLAVFDPAQTSYDADRKSTRLNSSHANISYAVFCLKKKKKHY